MFPERTLEEIFESGHAFAPWKFGRNADFGGRLEDVIRLREMTHNIRIVCTNNMYMAFFKDLLLPLHV